MAISVRFLWLVPCLALGLLVSAPVCAAGLPARADRSINDLAGLLAPADEPIVRGHLERLGRERGIDAVLVTLPSITDYGGTGRDIEGFARRLFDHWGIDDGQSNDGVLILLALEERAIRIELGARYGSRYDTRVDELVQTSVIPRLRAGDYSGGLREAAAGVARALANPPSAFSLTRLLGTGPQWSLELPFELLWVLFVVAGTFLVVRVSSWYRRLRDWLRRWPRPCRRCGRRMTRLAGDPELAQLDPGERKELALGSVAFFVWSCGACGNVQVLKYPGQDRSHKPCAKCGYRTLDEVQVVLRAPTEDREGLGRSKELCQHCGFRQERTYSLPRLSSASEDSGDSSQDRSSGAASGGGSSGGGGATGRW